MAAHRLLGEHVIFGEQFKDALGVNFRGCKLVNRKAQQHQLIELVDPVFSNDADAWKKIRILLEGVKKSNVPNFFSPREILGPMPDSGESLLVFDYFPGRSCEQIIKDAQAQHSAVPFDLAFAIAQNVAEIIDLGATIVIAGEKSFHGLLTPDNILISYEGKIALKNYGVFPYIDIHRNQSIYAELEKKYGSWLTPETLRRERVMPQSDVYHLGYLVYLMLTGKNFTLAEGEDFDQKLASLTFKNLLPQNDKEFLDAISFFFRRTLNPDPQKRFQNARELKAYIGSHFHLEELSTQTFNLAYFMNSLYGEFLEEDDKARQEELKFVLPEEKKVKPAPVERPATSKEQDSLLVQNILQGLDEKKKKSRWVYFVAGAAVLVVAVVLFFYFNQLGKTRQLEEEQLRQQAQLQSRLEEIDRTYEQRVADLNRAFEEQKATTEEEKRALEEQRALELENLRRQQQAEQARLRAQEVEQQQEEQRRLDEEAQAAAERLRQEEEARQRAEQEERQRQEEQQRRQLEESQRTKEGDTVGLQQLTVRPEKESGPDPMVTETMRRKYSGNNFTIMSQVLVNERGRVDDVRIIGNHPDDLKTLVRNTLLRWQYSVPMKDDVRVKVWISVPIRFAF